MARSKRLALIIGGVILVPVLLFIILWMRFAAASVPSEIIDFHPTKFNAKADVHFFYSVGDELKYSDEISPQAPTLLRGRIQNFMVSPDHKKIAVIANGKLVVVSAEESNVRQVAVVDSIYREPKPLGQGFIRDQDFQWSKDSGSLYIVKDEYYESKGSQLYSQKGELWRYELETAKLQLVLKPFPAYTYFFGKKSGMYFSVPTERGDLRLRYYDGQSVHDVGDVNVWEIPVSELASGFVEAPFFSFSSRDFNRLYSGGAVQVPDGNKGPARLVIGGKSYLALKQGQSIKGPYYCSDLYNSIFLPGDRYFLLNVPCCGNYQGQLLIDTVTGQYEPLPKDSRVFLTLNTDTVAHYRIGCGGMMIN